MSKRSGDKFDKIPNDLYRTWDYRAVRPLLPHLEAGTRFVEPCAGQGDLTDHLTVAGHRCVAQYDIDPTKRDGVRRGDARTLRWETTNGVWITNPPWTRALMHPIIRNLCAQAPLWALFDSDWLMTDQSAAFQPFLRKVIAVGRVRWIPGTTQDGFDNVAWYLFDGTRKPPRHVEFILRQQ